MPRVQTFYPRLGVASLSFEVKPSAFLEAQWDQTAQPFVGSRSRYCGTLAGAAQIQANPTYAAVPDGALNAQDIGIAQLLSDPLKEQLVEAANYTVAFGARLVNAAANYRWTPKASLFVVNGQTGARRATVFNLRAIGGALRTTADERTCLSTTVAGVEWKCYTGDFLCLELGMLVENTTGGAVVPQASIFADGTTKIGTDAAAIASAEARLWVPEPLYGSLPEFGEQPDPAVSFDEAVQVTKDHYPPSNPFDFDDTASPDYEFVACIANIAKLYGWDFVDLLLRELDPRSAAQRLPDFEAALGITFNRPAQDQKTFAQRRSAIIAKLRESGGTTLFNAAASVGPLAGYVNPTLVDIVELTTANLEDRDKFFEAVGQTVPADTDFGDANLIRRTPFLLDGGEVSHFGARLRLRFSSTDFRQVHARLTGPDGTAKTWSSLAPADQGFPEIASGEVNVLHAPEFGDSSENRTKLVAHIQNADGTEYTYGTSIGLANAGIVYVSSTDNVLVEHKVAGLGTVLSVDVASGKITVNVATNLAGNPLSTATECINKVRETESAMRLLHEVEPLGDGTGTVVASGTVSVPWRFNHRPRTTSAHGVWKLQLWREVGAPGINLVSWELYGPGAKTGGREGWKAWWGAFIDPAIWSDPDFNGIRAFLSRAAHAYGKGDLILTGRSAGTPIPGTSAGAGFRTIPGQFIPGV